MAYNVYGKEPAPQFSTPVPMPAEKEPVPLLSVLAPAPTEKEQVPKLSAPAVPPPPRRERHGLPFLLTKYGPAKDG